MTDILNTELNAVASDVEWVKTHSGLILEVWKGENYTAVPVPEGIPMDIEFAREAAPEAEYLRVNRRNGFGLWIVVEAGIGFGHELYS